MLGRIAIASCASISGHGGGGSSSVYCATKAGLINLTKEWARALAPDVRVNAIAPGVILTERVKNLLRPDDPLLATSVLGPCDPRDVAAMALFLASDESAQVTGAILPVDAGASAV